MPTRGFTSFLYGSGGAQNEMAESPQSLLPPRDSLELASLASTSNHEGGARESRESPSGGTPPSPKLSPEDDDDQTPPSARPLRALGGRRSFSISSAFDFN